MYFIRYAADRRKCLQLKVAYKLLNCEEYSQIYRSNYEESDPWYDVDDAMRVHKVASNIFNVVQ